MAARARFWLSLVFVVVAVVIAVMVSGVSWSDLQHLQTPRNAIDVNGESVKVPLPSPAEVRVLPVVEVTTTGAYAFMFEDAGSAVRYDPCRVIPLVINPAGGPGDGNAMILEAVMRVEAATGLKFAFEGDTTEPAAFGRSLIQPERYGERLVPVIIGWSSADATPELLGSVTGLGGSSSVTGAYGDDRYLTSGVVILDAPDLLDLAETPNGRALALTVIMHEIAHVVGLDHVNDPTELMNATNTSLADWGPGDRAGLALAGAGSCQDV